MEISLGIRCSPLLTPRKAAASAPASTSSSVPSSAPPSPPRSVSGASTTSAAAASLAAKFRVRLVGAPLRLVNPESSARGLDYEFLFEVLAENCSGLALPVRCVQRGPQHFSGLHSHLSEDFPGLALPMLPPARPAGLKGLLKPQEEAAQELAARLVAYLNTLLAMPAVSHCPHLVAFLELPEEPMEEPQGAAAEEWAIRASSPSIGCRSMCFRLYHSIRSWFSAFGAEDLLDQDAAACAGGGSGILEPGEDLERRRREILERHQARRAQGRAAGSGTNGAALLAPLASERHGSLPPGGARTLQLPSDAKLVEWR